MEISETFTVQTTGLYNDLRVVSQRDDDTLVVCNYSVHEIGICHPADRRADLLDALEILRERLAEIASQLMLKFDCQLLRTI